MTHNYQIQSSDCETHFSVTGIVVKSPPFGVRVNQSSIGGQILGWFENR